MTVREPIPSTVPDAPSVTVDLSEELDVGSFQLRNRIGSGAKSEVYRYALPTGQTIAVKVPDTSRTISRESVDEVLREAEKWDQLGDADHIVSVIDYGLAEGKPWIAMEYMDGGHLREFLDQRGIESLAHGLWIARGIAKGLDQAHYRGIAHQDIKPQNILFREVDGKWNVPKIGDWGTARPLLDSAETIGEYTPRYASPEQHAGDVHRNRLKQIDVFQFGIVLFLLFTGTHPYGRTTKSSLVESPPTPSEVRPGIPVQLEELMLNCLERDPSDRYREIGPVLDQLDSLWNRATR